MHGLEQIIALNAKAGNSSIPADLSAFKPFEVKQSPAGWYVHNSADFYTGQPFNTYAQAVADMIARHAGHEDVKHLGFAAAA